MSRFDLYRGSGSIDYYVDVQSDFHAHLQTRMVIPVLARSRIQNPVRDLHLPITINDAPHYLVVPMMGAIPTRILGKPVAHARDQDYEITAAIDFLLQGF